MVGSREFGKKKKVDTLCDPVEERSACLLFLLTCIFNHSTSHINP
ncbi:hypothetical protein HMPREF0083_04375 [Aneurinibacillus aneurinilyticus ATCC 12856]|uniref:Uncharacterized protein n=1 Tax=Aneurinibacillus aneurinilyticus ATCC 12856 TaxID=649747 RepID=U1WY17_ANEAE|nr:hypothetical protein HMPREF0083_04375 [Aneurinibacillus aneurinilyticus ATCC 12856]